MNQCCRTWLAGIAALVVVTTSVQAQPQVLKIGAGAVLLQPRGGDASVPEAPFRTEAQRRLPIPTNQWYSSLVFSAEPENLYAQPLSFRATRNGFEMALPRKQVVPTERLDVEIHYPHRAPIVISPAAFATGQPLLAKTSDWAIDIAMGQGSDSLQATIAHGSPYAWFQLNRGDVRLRLPASGQRIAVGDPRALLLRVDGTPYALFGPGGVRWEQVSATEWLGRMPAGRGYFSAAALPDESAATIDLFVKHAYSFVTDTRVDWQVDGSSGLVRTSFKATTRAMEGPDAGPLLGLYPHHWHKNASVEGRLGPAYDTIRGKIRLLPASQFTTTTRYTGFVPYWPAITDSPRLGQLRDVMKTDLRNARRMMLEEGKGPYWQGKGLQRIVKLMDVFEAQGDLDGRDRLLAMLKKRVEEWFSGTDRKNYFVWDQKAGTVVSYPEEYFAVVQMNDHHFHYGYWIRAIAEIALRDPTWASKTQWGGMVDLLVKDIASTDRSRSEFPFLRNFDPYEGHSWASGIGLGDTGNNQESSSEALNAWTGLILWGIVNGDAALRDLGVWLLATETESVRHYWFDVHQIVFAPEYKNPDVSMLFGAKYSHNTWWIDDPRQITGINLLPITTSSTYFALDPAYIRRNLGALPDEQEIWARRGKRVKPADIWQDVFVKYLALADPQAALAQWDRWGAVELGDTRSHTLHFLLSLAEMGPPDLSVSANTPLYQVFKRADGRRTYLAFNASSAPIEVQFSDGRRLSVAPGKLARTMAP